MSFQIGDRVRVTKPGCRATFEVTDIQVFNGVTCYTGPGHLWWPAESLQFDLTVEQNALAERYERALHTYHEAESELDKMEVELIDTMPEWWHDRSSRIE